MIESWLQRIFSVNGVNDSKVECSVHKYEIFALQTFIT